MSGPVDTTVWTSLTVTTIGVAVVGAPPLTVVLTGPPDVPGRHRDDDVARVRPGVAVGGKQISRRARRRGGMDTTVPAKLTPLFELTATLPPVSTTWTK